MVTQSNLMLAGFNLMLPPFNLILPRFNPIVARSNLFLPKSNLMLPRFNLMVTALCLMVAVSCLTLPRPNLILAALRLFVRCLKTSRPLRRPLSQRISHSSVRWPQRKSPDALGQRTLQTGVYPPWRPLREFIRRGGRSPLLPTSSFVPRNSPILP